MLPATTSRGVTEQFEVEREAKQSSWSAFRTAEKQVEKKKNIIRWILIHKP